MLVTGFPAAVFGTNCYVLAPAAGEECVVVDPGIGVLDTLAQVLREMRLKPAAVLLTHGHIDHLFSVTPVCGAHDVPALVHADDLYRVQDPVSTLMPELKMMLRQQYPGFTWSAPDDVRLLADHQVVDIAGLSFTVRHAPGHTEGSVLFSVPGAPDQLQGVEVTSTALTGDVVFAGSIGRTDLPGGDPDAMTRSLRDVILPLPDDTLFLPGHGGATTMGRERHTNPYLQIPR